MTNPVLPVEAEALLTQLLQKTGSWVDWGRACQQLQKEFGCTLQQIFEQTGFQPALQNQLVVAAQVYTGLEQGQADVAVLDYYRQRGSESLYELRVLPQESRVGVAQLLWTKQVDSEGAREVVKAIKEFSYLKALPDGFTAHPGDQVAYQCWQTTRQKTDLQERSRLIARGLTFAYSPSARHKIELLLTDFTVVKARPAPKLPLYRLESVDETPCLVAVVGRLPLTKADLTSVPLLKAEPPFQVMRTQSPAAWVALPGWQVLRLAQDAVILMATSDELALPGKVEEVLIVVDRNQRDWQEDAYFVYEAAEQLKIRWFAQDPAEPLLGRIILVMRPPKIFDEAATLEPWQLDE